MAAMTRKKAVEDDVREIMGWGDRLSRDSAFNSE